MSKACWGRGGRAQHRRLGVRATACHTQSGNLPLYTTLTVPSSLSVNPITSILVPFLTLNGLPVMPRSRAASGSSFTFANHNRRMVVQNIDPEARTGAGTPPLQRANSGAARSGREGLTMHSTPGFSDSVMAIR